MANIAIFRINYKSDFILTLNSDAGWLTPFCIKFWTGAPSQAYFVGFDGETYTHCAPVEGEPTKLVVQFDDHHLPIGDLKFQIGYHFTVTDFPTSVEDEVLNQASVIIEVNDAPAQVMLDLNGETAPEIEFSLPAYANEAQRIANEQARIAAEQQRIANEDARIQAEETRQQNEAQRIAQETARVNEFATLKSQSQAATSEANDAATLANQKAQLAADKAALANDAATLAIQKAQLAADKAALANDAAQLANEKAALAQQKAEYAQQQGGYAKDQGDYAKDQGDYAKAQGETAQADHERAEADHGIAVDDHTQAGNDHTRAESDHGVAANDHTQADNDHTRAESDHGIAANDHTQAGNDHTRAESDHGIAADDHTQAGNDHTRAESDHTRAESDHAAVEMYVDSLGVFDLSKHNAVGGVLATYADLSAALTALNALESKYKYGGMSFKFVQSSDNKYVQFRCMAQNFTTDVTQWQGVDDEPTAGSNNLVKSGGVYNALENKAEVSHYNLYDESRKVTGILNSSGKVTTDGSGSNFKTSPFIEIKGNTSYCVRYATHSAYNVYCWYDANRSLLSYNVTTSNASTYILTSPSNAKYIRISTYGSALGDAVSESSEVVPYKSYTKTLLNDDTDLNSNQLNQVNTAFIEALQQEILLKADVLSMNLYDESKKVTGLLNYSNGVLNSYSTGFRTSPYIEVKGNTKYYINYATRANDNVICWYDSNKQNISESGEQRPAKDFVVTSPQTAAYLRISMYGTANGTMIAESDKAVSYIAYGVKFVLDDNVLLNESQIAAATEEVNQEITSILEEIDVIENGKENTYQILTRIGNAAQHYDGNIGDNIADCIVSGGGRYSAPITEGETYIITYLTLDPVLITNSNGVVIAKYAASAIVGGMNNYMLRFTAPQGATMAYISGVYDNQRAPAIYTVENDNKIVINKGYKKTFTASDTNLLSVANKSIFKEKANILHCAGGTGSITLSIDTAYRSAGIWLNVPYQYFGSERLNSISVTFKNNDTTIKTISINKNKENKEYFNVKDWAFLFMQNVDSNTNRANKAVISWALEDENDSIDIFIYPYIIVNFLFFPTVLFNLEHWDASSGMNRGILSHGLKLVVSGNLPSAAEDIQYAKECVANGLLEYGFYARENGGNPAVVPSLEEGTDMKDMPTYIYDRIQAKIGVSKEQHFYGGGAHTIPPKAALVGKMHGIDEYRFYNGQGMSIITDEDSCIMIPTNYLLLYNYYVPNLEGVFSYFDHSGSSGNQYDDSTFGVSFTKLKALCDAGFCLNMTPMELKNYKKEFVITEYKELL